MKPKDFIRCIQSEVVAAHLREYFEVLDGPQTDDDGGPDAYWLAVTELYARLPSKDRETIRWIMRRVSIESVSGVLAVLDGVAILPKYRKDFRLTYGEKHELNGELQDLFIDLNEKEWLNRDAGSS